MAKLDDLPDAFLGLDLPALRRAVVACISALEAGAPPNDWPSPPRLGDA